MIRAEGQGKLTLCLTGESPPGGLAVALSGDNPAALMLPPTITIPESSACLSIAVDAGAVDSGTPVLVTARYKGVSRFSDTIVRDFGDDPTPTAVSTNPAPTATSTIVAATQTSTATGVLATATTVPPTGTATATRPTATPTAVRPTATATATIGDGHDRATNSYGHGGGRSDLGWLPGVE